MKKIVTHLEAAPSGDTEPDSPLFVEGQLQLDIDQRDARWQPLLVTLKAHAALVWRELALPSCEICMVLADDTLLAELNQNYRDKSGPTNVLSFPAQDFVAPQSQKTMRAEVNKQAGQFAGAPLLLGDIVLSYDRLLDEVAGDDARLSNHAMHLVTHGILHLMGHDHMQTDEAEIMESLETQLMQAAGLPDPYGAHAGDDSGDKNHEVGR